MVVLWDSAVREIRHWPISPLFWWLMVLAPLLCFGLLVLVLGTGDVRKMPVALLDQDRTPLSRELTRWIDATPSMKISALVTDAEEGNTLLRSGKVYAFILIPRNFERDVLRKRPVRPVAWVEGQHMVTAGVLSRDFSELGLALWRKHDVSMRKNAGVPAAVASLQASTISLDLRPIVNPSTNYKIFLLPGLLPALLQICATIMATCVLAKLAEVPSSASAWQQIVGALLPVTAWFWLLGCGLSGLLILWGDLTLQSSFAVIALAYLGFSLAAIGLGLLFYAITDTMIQALSVTSAFSSPAFAFAGLTFPLASMPLLAKMWAALLPITHLMKISIQCGLLGSPVSAQMSSFYALGLLFLLSTGLGLPLAAHRISAQAKRGVIGHKKQEGGQA